MGSLCSSGYEKIGDDPVPTQIRVSTGTASLGEQITQNWKTDILSIWSKSPSDLPIHIDIPRLYRKISVTNSSYPMRSHQQVEGEMSEFDHIFYFLDILAEGLDDNTTQTFLKEKLHNYNVTREIPRLLRDIVIDLEKVENVPRTLRILKVLNQKIIFPAYYCMKHTLGFQNTKDKRGTWYIDVHIRHGGIRVIHRKTQLVESRKNFSEIDVEFTFHFIMELNASCSEIVDSHIEIKDVIISDNLSQEERNHYKELFEKHMYIQ